MYYFLIFIFLLSSCDLIVSKRNKDNSLNETTETEVLEDSTSQEEIKEEDVSKNNIPKEETKDKEPELEPVVTPQVPAFIDAPMDFLADFASNQSLTTMVFPSAYYTVKVATGLNSSQIEALNHDADVLVEGLDNDLYSYWLNAYRKNDQDFVYNCLGSFPKTFTSVRTGLEHTVINYNNCREETSDKIAREYFATDFGLKGNFPAKFKSDGRIQTLYGSMLGDCKAITALPVVDCDKFE